MTPGPEHYLPAGLYEQLRRSAWRVWAVGLAVVLIWTLLTVAAPLARSSGLTAFAVPIYHFFSYICHQIDERSFHAAGEPFAVCSRCFGVYLGLFLGFAVYPAWRPVDNIEAPPRFWLFLSLIPLIIDWALTVFGIWENTQLSRLITGLILGATCATFMVPALVEITRNLKQRRRPV